jgi:hypothetical protein
VAIAEEPDSWCDKINIVRSAFWSSDMSNPEADAELAKAIEDRTIPIAEPPAPAEPIESREAEEPETPHEHTSGLGLNVDDFQIDVPPPEGI